MRIFVVVNYPEDWPLDIAGVEVVDAKSYLKDPRYSTLRNARVFNLCRSYRYQTIGYYVSLLASARGHKPQPNLTVIEDFKSPAMIHFISQELDEIIQESLKNIQADRFTLSIYFGKNISKRYDRLSSHLFKEFQAPFVRAEFFRTDGEWNLSTIKTIAGNDIPLEHRDFVLERAKDYFAGKRSSLPKRNAYRYDLAILYNPNEKHAPSDPKAIQKFIKAADQLGINTEIISKEDYRRLPQFDALFIRETTQVNHYTYRFARRASAQGLVVIDDPQSILRCTNKVYLAELLEVHRVPTPKTVILDKDTIQEAMQKLSFPFIVKLPDSSFSQGVIKVENKEEFQKQLAELLEQSDLLIAQEFLPTAFDWRVGILNRQPIFVCKYFMVKSHWQIYNHKNTGKSAAGKFETIPVQQAPRKILSTALKAANLIGDGLYGVDLKQIGSECRVIEVNDNPNIDYGIEDLDLKDDLYWKIMGEFLHRIERKKTRF